MIIIHDEDARGNRFHTIRIDNDKDVLTVEALIRLRVASEVKRFNVQRPVCFFCLVQPEDVEITSRGYRLKKHRDIDWQVQSNVAVEAFENESFLINMGGQDYRSLLESIEIKDGLEIVFVKFTEIIGG